MLQTWQVFMDSYRSRILMLINETKKKKIKRQNQVTNCTPNFTIC